MTSTTATTTTLPAGGVAGLPRYLFVYGTLKKGEVNHRHWLAPYIRSSGSSSKVGGGNKTATSTTATANSNKGNCCDCHLIFAGTARSIHRYPFFTNVGATEGTCAPCVVDAAITDDDLARTYVPCPPEWQGCAATVDEALAKAAAAGATTNTTTPQNAPKNKYYNIFPQRVLGEAYRIVRCGYCKSLVGGRRAAKGGKGAHTSPSSAATKGSVASSAAATTVSAATAPLPKIAAVCSSGNNTAVVVEEYSQMMQDFDELECTRTGVYTRRPIRLELLVRSATDAAHAAAAGVAGYTSDTLTKGDDAAVAAAADDDANASSTSSSSAAALRTAALKQKIGDGLMRLSSDATAVAAATGGMGVAGPTGSSHQRYHHGTTTHSTTHNNTTNGQHHQNVFITADIYFRTNAYPREQLVEMVKRSLGGPARAKVETLIEPLVSDQLKMMMGGGSGGAVGEGSGDASTATPLISQNTSATRTTTTTQQQQQQPHIQGFLSNFSVVKSLALSYPSRFSYVAPHLRKSSTASSTCSAATNTTTTTASSILRQLPPSILGSGGVLPPPMALVVLDGMGDYSSGSLREGCSDGIVAAAGGTVGDANGGGHSDHGACLPTKMADVNFSTAIPPALQSSAAAIRTFSPLELVSLLKVAGVSQEVGAQPSSIPSTTAVNEEDGLHIITRNGYSGLMDPCKSGLACGSDTAHLNLLGFDPSQYYRGRGSFETIGSGLMMQAGDIAFKCNFATMAHNSTNTCNDGGGGGRGSADKDEGEAFFSSPTSTPVVINRRADREFTREGPILCEALNGTRVTAGLDGEPFVLGGSGGGGGCEGANDASSPSLQELLFGGNNNNTTNDNASTQKQQQPLSYEILVRYATEHRCGVVIRGPHLSDGISGTDPLVNNKALIWCTPTTKAPSREVLEAEIYGRFKRDKTTGQIVDAKLGLPLTTAQKQALIEKEAQLWYDYHSAVLTCKVVNAASAAMTKILMHHPINISERLPVGKPLANVVLLRGAAQLSDKMPSVVHRHGSRAVAVAPTAIIKGLAKTAGFDIIDDVAGATGSYNSALGKKADAMIQFYQEKAATFAKLFAAAFGGGSGDAADINTTQPTCSDNVQRIVRKLRRAEARQQEALLYSNPLGSEDRGGVGPGVNSAVRWVPNSRRKYVYVPTAATTSSTATTPSHAAIPTGAIAIDMGSFDDADDGANAAYDVNNASSSAAWHQRQPQGGSYGEEENDGTADEEEEEEEEMVDLSALQCLSAFVQTEVYDLCFVHVKGTDDAGHDRDLPKRIAMARRAGDEVLGRLWRGMPAGTTIAVTADHTTAVAMGDHSTEPVPFSVATTTCCSSGGGASGGPLSAGAPDGCPYFTEACCELYGSLGRFHGKDMLAVMRQVHER